MSRGITEQYIADWHLVRSFSCSFDSWHLRVFIASRESYSGGVRLRCISIRGSRDWGGVPVKTCLLYTSKRQIENINLWLKQIISEDPQTKRTRVGATKYVIGFPPPALVKDMGQSMNDYVPGQISLEAYVQVNIDAPFEGVKRILQQAAIEENIPADADKAAGATVQTILSSLDTLRAFELADVPAPVSYTHLLPRRPHPRPFRSRISEPEGRIL